MTMRRWAGAAVLLVGTLSSGCTTRPGAPRVATTSPPPTGGRATTTAVTPAAPAPQGDTSPVPRELVVALMSGGMRPVALRVGTAADAVPAELYAGWQPLGSSTTGPASVSVFRAPYSSRVAQDSLKARFERAGWTPPTRPTSSFERGFISTSMIGPYSAHGYCDGTRQHASYHATSRLANEAQVFINVQGGGTSMCSVIPGMVRFDAMMDSMPIPRLLPPADLYVMQTGSNSAGVEGWGMDAQGTGRVSVTDALRHYAEQLVASGWTTSDVADAGLGIAAQGFTRTFAGRSWFGMLAISAPPGAQRLLLHFQMRAM